MYGFLTGRQMMIPFVFVLIAVFIPFVPWCSWQQAYPACPTLLTPGVCAGFSLEQQLGWAFSPQCMEYCSPRVSIPGTKGQSCPLLPLLFSLPRLLLLSKPCSSPQIWQQLLEGQPEQSAAVPASFHCSFSLSLSGPLASVNAC